MKTVNIKGKEYVTVNERLLHFRNAAEYKGWRIVEDLVGLDEKEGIFKVTIMDPEGNEITSAHAQEYRDSSYINKTSFLENLDKSRLSTGPLQPCRLSNSSKPFIKALSA